MTVLVLQEATFPPLKGRAARGQPPLASFPRPPSATTCTWVPAQVSDQSGSRRVTLFDCFGPACRCCRPSLHLDPRSLRRPPSRHRLQSHSHQSHDLLPLQPGLPLRGAAHPRAATPLEPRPHRPPDRRPSLEPD